MAVDLNKRIGSSVLVAWFVLAGTVAAPAATYLYDFKAAANSSGSVGENAFATYSTGSDFVGPNLDITADASSPFEDDDDQFVYFDNGNAGIGVCRDLNGATADGTTNLCSPSSDDGMTSPHEWLTFTATDGPMKIDSIWINSNHDATSILASAWEINGVTYDLTSGYSMINDGGLRDGDVKIELGGFWLGAGSSFQVIGTVAPDSYISALAISSVPIPAALPLLAAGLGGLGFAGRRSKTKLPGLRR